MNSRKDRTTLRTHIAGGCLRHALKRCVPPCRGRVWASGVWRWWGRQGWLGGGQPYGGSPYGGAHWSCLSCLYCRTSTRPACGIYRFPTRSRWGCLVLVWARGAGLSPVHPCQEGAHMAMGGAASRRARGGGLLLCRHDGHDGLVCLGCRGISVGCLPISVLHGGCSHTVLYCIVLYCLYCIVRKHCVAGRRIWRRLPWLWWRGV